MLRGRTLPAALAALALVLALIQRPGLASSDTKVDLHVDPGGFLGDVASAWSGTGDLGHVQGGQYGGYLFPMGPFFALGHWLGVAPWLIQRLWLALILALAAWGAVRLMDELAGPRGRAHAVTGLLVLLNPYVVVFSARTSVTLLGYAVLPWLLVCAHRGLKGTVPTTGVGAGNLSRGRLRGLSPWWWPAAIALIVTGSGGGVNAAVTAWVLLGPLLLVLYERWIGAVEWRAIFAFGWRAIVATAVVSAWWIVPLLVQSGYGVDFLRFTEQPGTIWSTTSLPESLRLMGYWISYLGVGYGGDLRPYFGGGGVLLFALPVVVAGLLVPALALASFARTRVHPYAPFALGLVLVGLIAMSAGFPEGTPFRRALNFTYNNVLAVQFLRTTYKAGPLVALGVAVLAGFAARRTWMTGAVLALAVLACWPLVRGRGLDDQLLWDHVPAAWQDAAAHVDATAGDGRAVVLPGQLYANYDWGGTVDPILPVLAERPVAVRNAVGYADLHAVDLLWTVDALVQQRRALPGQLDPLLDLLGARTVVTGADDDRTRSGAAPAAEAADVLDQLGAPDATWGRTSDRPRAAGTLGAPRPLPEVRAWDRPDAPGLVRIESAQPDVVVDGSAEGVAALAAMGDLGTLAYAGDLSPAAIRGAREVVITDSNRRRVLVPSRLAQNAGPTLSAGEAPSIDAAVLNPFEARGSDAQTVAVYDGITAVRAPSSPGFPQFPERRPFAAIDGDTATHWQADRNLTQDRHTLDVTFREPRDVDEIRLLPYNDRRGTVTAVEVQGRRFAVRPGWNTLRVGLRRVKTLRVRIAAVRKPEGPTAGAGGIRELEMAGLQAREALRPPVLAERALAGQDLSRTGLTYLFQRTTGDDPFRRDPRRGPSGAVLVRDRLDGETGVERVLSLPAARTWTVDGWATPAAHAQDFLFDLLVGQGTQRYIFNASPRFEGRPGFRASSAFDGTARPWVGSWLDGRHAWLEWGTPSAVALQTLTLDPAPGVRRPTRVRLTGDGRASAAVDVGPDGVVRLPEPMRGSRFRLEILRAAFGPGTPGAERQRRAVGIAEIRGTGVPSVEIPRSGTLSRECFALRGSVGEDVLMRAEGTIADLDAGRPLRVSGCEPLTLPAGPARLSFEPQVLAPYLIRLRSAGAGAPPAAPGRVVDAGTATRGGRTGIRLALDAPARLVLAESYNRGRRARCDGRDLGEPEVGAAFGTAWRVPASCREAEITFAPNRLVTAGYVLSLVSGLFLLALVVLRRAPGRVALPATAVATTPRRLSARRAALIALPVALAFGFVFAARATPLFALGVFFVLWRGVGTRELALAGGAVLGIAVPILTVLIRPENRGGYNPEYSIDRITVHWVTVAGVSLLVLALARELSRARARPDRARGAPPTAAAQPGPAP